MGYASSEAVVLTLIILVLTLIQFRVIRVDGE
jgi:ABC-type sugar transport system permease subunit